MEGATRQQGDPASTPGHGNGDGAAAGSGPAEGMRPELWSRVAQMSVRATHTTMRMARLWDDLYYAGWGRQSVLTLARGSDLCFESTGLVGRAGAALTTCMRMH